MAEDGNQSHQESESSQSEDPWRQGEQQLVRVMQVHTFVRRRMLALAHLVVETSDKSCSVDQEEEYDGRGIKVGLSFCDHDGSKRCAITLMLVGNACSLYNCTPCSDREERDGVLMMKFKGKFAPVEQDEPFEES